MKETETLSFLVKTKRFLFSKPLVRNGLLFQAVENDAAFVNVGNHLSPQRSATFLIQVAPDDDAHLVERPGAVDEGADERRVLQRRLQVGELPRRARQLGVLRAR